MSILYILTALLLCTFSNADFVLSPSPKTPVSSTAETTDNSLSFRTHGPHHVRRYPKNTSPIVAKYAALGDSFTAGPSAGQRYDNNQDGCDRFTEGLGPQINSDSRLQLPANGNREFYFPACTGAILTDVYKQIDGLAGDTDLATLTIGGNDCYFGSIINACIYGLKPNLGCETNIQAAQSQIDSPQFDGGLHNVIQTLLNRAPKVRLYVVGYPAFFNVDSSQCDGIGFDLAGSKKLTKELRLRLNDLVAQLNLRTRKAVERIFPESQYITFLDPNSPFDGHRFCEDGITEPDYDNPDTWFYPWTYNTRPWLYNMPGCNEANGNDQLGCGIQSLAAGNDPPTSDPDERFLGIENALQFRRIFHPTTKGFGGMADLVVKHFMWDFETGYRDSISQQFEDAVNDGIDHVSDGQPDDTGSGANSDGSDGDCPPNTILCLGRRKRELVERVSSIPPSYNLTEAYSFHHEPNSRTVVSSLPEPLKESATSSTQTVSRGYEENFSPAAAKLVTSIIAGTPSRGSGPSTVPNKLTGPTASAMRPDGTEETSSGASVNNGTNGRFRYSLLCLLDVFLSIF